MTIAPPPDPAIRADSAPLFAQIARHLATQWKAPMAAIVAWRAQGPEILGQVGLTEPATRLARAEAARLASPDPSPAPTPRHASIRFLASAPLSDQSGQAIGALVVMDRRARGPSRRNRAALADLAAVVSLSLMLHLSLEQLDEIAITDPLTGLYNRRGLDRLFARHAGSALALLAIDIDDFKAVNDTHGHSAGDRALVHVAQILRQSVRVSDIVARTGGDEFLVLLPDTDDVATATQVARRIHASLADQQPAPPMPALTLSIGIAHSSSPTDLASLQALADAQLRAAKADGKARSLGG